ncbi:MAG: methionine ABC transporter ATP-binding protein [Pyramidobacter sp.]|jgi:D-methionine transport system ATP-binding protein
MIQLCGIKKVFESPDGTTVEALSGIDLNIDDGEIFGIIGLSGAGKSTLLRTINRLEEPSGGKVLIDGQDITALKPRELRTARRHIGMIFQHFNLLASRDVAGNIAFPLELDGWKPKAIKDRVAELLEFVELSDKAHAYPSQLSGGQKQRVAIARALANNPRVLLSDEATSALDPKTTKSILNLLASINRHMGLTIVIITHEMNVIREVCRHVAILEAGRIVEQGAVRDIFMNPKSRTAREFLSKLPRTGYDVNVDLPREAGKPVALLTFDGAAATEPLISRTVKETGADINILAGAIDRLYFSRVGTLTVQFEGSPEVIAAALNRIRSSNVKAEVIWNG